jgi:hypothetical protein
MCAERLITNVVSEMGGQGGAKYTILRQSGKFFSRVLSRLIGGGISHYGWASARFGVDA